MPDVSGLDIARYLYHSNPNTKVIFLSAYKDFEYARQAISYGIFSYLVKPITIEALTDALSEVYMTLSKPQQQNQFKGNAVNSAMRQCFIYLLSDRDTDTAAFADRFSQLGFPIEL